MDRKVVLQKVSHYCYHDSPLGLLLLAGCKHALRMISFPTGFQVRKPLSDWQQAGEDMFTDARRELDEYFNGKRSEFTVTMELEGTDFQKRVWQALINIPFGALMSYGDVAKALGDPRAARAVGGANNANPIPIIVPCHRVVGSDKSLIGYGGGLDIKKFLIRHEAKHAAFKNRLL